MKSSALTHTHTHAHRASVVPLQRRTISCLAPMVPSMASSRRAFMSWDFLKVRLLIRSRAFFPWEQNHQKESNSWQCKGKKTAIQLLAFRCTLCSKQERQRCNRSSKRLIWGTDRSDTQRSSRLASAFFHTHRKHTSRVLLHSAERPLQGRAACEKTNKHGLTPHTRTTKLWTDGHYECRSI